MPLYLQASAGTYREYPDRAAFDATTAFTVAVWGKYHSAPGATNTHLVCRHDDGAVNTGMWSLGTRSAASGFQCFATRTSAGAVASTTGVVPTPGVWDHYCGRATGGGNGEFFLNGSLVDTDAIGTIGGMALAVRVGENTGGSAHADASVAHFGYWNVSLTNAQIAALASGMPPHMIRPDALIVADELDGRSIDFVGMIRGTDTGNVQDAPWTEPLRRGYLRSPRMWAVPPPLAIRRKRADPNYAAAASITGTATVSGAAKLTAAAAASVTGTATVAGVATLTEVSQFDAVLWGRQGRRPILQAYIEGLPDVICTEVPAGGDAKVTGYCLDFDGVNDYAATGNVTDLTPTGDFTVLVWFNPDAWSANLANNSPILSWTNGLFTKGFRLGINTDAGARRVYLQVGGTFQYSTNIAAVTGKWQCLVLSVGGSVGLELRFLLIALNSDGSLSSVQREYVSAYGGSLGPSRATRDSDSAGLTAAIQWATDGNYFDGKIGYTAIYKRSMTASEMERLVYRILDAKWTGFWSDLQVQVVFSEGSGSTAKNSSSGGSTYHVTTISGATWSLTNPWTITYRPYMTAIAALGQDLEARATRTTVSTLSFQVLDPGAGSGWWLTAYLKRVTQAVRRKSCYIFMGFDEILEEDYELIMNGALEAIDPLKQRGYEVRVGDAVRFARTSLLLGKTRLATSCTNVATTIEVDSLFNFRGRSAAAAVAGTAITGYIRIDDEIIQYDAVASGPNSFTSCTRARFGTSAAAHTAGATVTEVFAELNVNPITMLLNLLLSNTGQLMTHATYDKYTRYTADDGSSYDGRGAAVALADIDVTDIEAVKTAHYSSYAGDVLILDSIDNLKDWIEENLLRPLGAFFVTQSDGTLTIGTWHTPSATGAVTLEQGDQAQPEPSVDYSRIINSIVLRCDLNPVTGAYGKILAYDDVDSGRDHGPSAPLRIDSPWIRTNGIQSGAAFATTPSTIGDDLKTLLFARFADPQPIYTAPAGLRWWSKEIGGALKYQHEEIPDFVDGERGVMGALTQIVGRTLDPKRARVVLKLMRTP